MGKGPDKGPRKKRRKLTAKEKVDLAAARAATRAAKESANKKKQEEEAEEQRPRGLFFASMEEKEAHRKSKEACADTNDDIVDNKDIVYEDLSSPASDTLTEGSFHVASMEDLDMDDNERDINVGVMKVFARKVMLRLREECRKKRQTTLDGNVLHPVPTKEKWLLKFLENNGFWIRHAHVPFLYKKLFCTTLEQGIRYYYQDIFVWLPSMQHKECAVPCPFCGSSSGTSIHAWTLDHPIRRIINLDSSYWLMSAQYSCTNCVQRHDAHASGPRPKRTFMATHLESMKLLPTHISLQFPAFLTKRSGMDLKLVEMMRPLFDSSGMGAESFAAMLKENHMRRYTDLFLSFESDRQARPLLYQKWASRMFSSFSDPTGYNGRLPSATYIATVYKDHYATRREFYSLETKKLPCEHLKCDASYKAPKKLFSTVTKKMFDCLVTGSNEHGQIRVQVLSASDAHDQLRPALQAMSATQESYGMGQVKLVTTDNPTKDESFYLEMFPGVVGQQEKFDKVAKAFNDKNRSKPPAPAPAQQECTNDCILEDTISVHKIKVVSGPTNIARNVQALDDLMGNTNRIFSLDTEWDTAPWKAKVGLVAVMQIGYHDPTDDAIKAIVMQLPRRGALPPELVQFLTDPRNSFTGVNVESDIKMLEKDYEFKRTNERNPTVINLSKFAQRRAVVAKANMCSMQRLVRLVLNEEMDKAESIRCSKWSARQLSANQIQYAGMDVIKPLQVYEKLLQLPDLQERFKAGQDREQIVGTKVDIVPRRGLVSELNTRGGVGVVCDKTRLSYPTGLFLKQHIQIDPTREAIVEVSEVTGLLLKIPSHKLAKTGAVACLGDLPLEENGGTFQVALPLCMLRRHYPGQFVESYGAADNNENQADSGVRCITRPSSMPARKSTELHGNGQPSSTGKSKAEKLSDETILDVEDIDDDDDEIEDVELSELLCMGEIGDENEECPQIDDRQSQLIRQAATVADGFESNPEVYKAMMICKDLPDPPAKVERKYKAVLGDVFHLMHRIKISSKHDCKKGFLRALMDAIFEFRSTRFEEVCEKLKEAGWTDEDIKDKPYYDPRFFLRRVERFVPPSDLLYWRVRAVLVTFGHCKDAKSGLCLFRNPKMWKQASSILSEIKDGYYSDPPGYNFYHYVLDSAGNPIRDRYGIAMIRSTRGTNSVENTHRQYSTTFRFRAGIEFADCLLGERRHRQNQRISQKQFEGYPDVGHFDTWKIDMLQNLIEQNHGKRLYDTWTNSSDFCSTPESFTVVALHDEALAKALDKVSLGNDATTNYSRDLQYLCNAMGTKAPFLPVHGEDEYKLFARLVLETEAPLDLDNMALRWMQHVDAKKIFPKLPAHLRIHLRRHEQNTRVRKAVRNMQNKVLQLNAINLVFQEKQNDRHSTKQPQESPSTSHDNAKDSADQPLISNLPHDKAKENEDQPLISDQDRTMLADAPPTLPTPDPRAFVPASKASPFFVGKLNVTGVQHNSQQKYRRRPRQRERGPDKQSTRKARSCKKCGKPYTVCLGATRGERMCSVDC